jgi:hypothetical protein
MIGRIKLAGLIAALLVIFLPSFTLAQDVNFSVSPAEVKMDNLPPGEAAEFELTIHLHYLSASGKGKKGRKG